MAGRTNLRFLSIERDDKCKPRHFDGYLSMSYLQRKIPRSVRYDLGSCQESLCVWLRAAYVFSSSAFREVALLKLQKDTGASAASIKQMWACVMRAAQGYKGYKRSFGKLIQREMTVASLPLRTPGYSAARLKLLSQGEHQSQNTIEATGLLRKAGPSHLPKLALDRTECLIRLLLVTPHHSERKL